jgi:hypothetical protein
MCRRAIGPEHRTIFIAACLVVAAVAVTQTVVTATRSYTPGGRGLRVLLAEADTVLPKDAAYVIVWACGAAKPGRAARDVLYPRRQILLTEDHRLPRATARSDLRASGVSYVVLVGRRGCPAIRKLYATLGARWSHAILRRSAGAVYRVAP